MGANDMRVTVKPPLRRPPTYGLVNSAPLAEDNDVIDTIAADAALKLGVEFDVMGDLIFPGEQKVRIWCEDVDEAEASKRGFSIVTADAGVLVAAMGDNFINPSAVTPAMGGLLRVPSAQPYRWMNGWTFLPELCVGGGRGALDCIGDTSVFTPDLNPGLVVGDPFVVWGADTCSTFGFEARDYKGRAQRLLSGIQSFEIAQELWTNSLGLANTALTDSVAGDPMTAPGSPVDGQTALSLIEQGLADRLRGSKGMVHVTPQMLAIMVSNYHVRREGNLWLTAMDNIVVADAGYDGSGPGNTPPGATQWIYGSSMIYLYLGPVQVLPDEFYQALDRARNQVTFIAERIAGFKWDHCGLVSAEVNVPIGDQGGTPGS